MITGVLCIGKDFVPVINELEKRHLLTLILGFINCAVYFALSAVGPYVVFQNITWFALLSPAGYREIYRALSGLLVHVLVSAMHVTILYVLTRSIALSLLVRFTVIAQLWLVGLDYPSGSILVRELIALALGLYVAKYVSKAIPRHYRVYSYSELKRVLSYMKIHYFTRIGRRADYSILAVLLASHALALSFIVLHEYIVLGLYSHRMFVPTATVALTLIPLIQLILAIAVHYYIEHYALALFVGLSSGMGLLGLIPMLLLLGSLRLHQQTLSTPARVATGSGGIYLGTVLAELKSKVLEKEEWYWAQTSFPLYVDPERLNTPHMIIVGASGTGKTTLAKHLIHEMKKNYGYTLIVIDPHGEYRNLAEKLNFRVVDASTSSVNPLSLGNASPKERSMQVAHVISAIFNLGPLQRRMVEEVIIESYSLKGINQENPSTWSHDPPTLADLVETCKKLSMRNPEYYRILPYLEMLNESLSARTLLSIDEIFEHDTVIDLSRVPSDFARAVFVDTLMYLLLSRMYSMKAKKIQLLIDEARSLMPRAVTREILNRLFVESRKFGFSIVVISQEISRVPRDLINNAGIRVFFLLNDPRSLEEASRILSGVVLREKVNAIAEALRTLKPHTFMVHITGSSSMYIVKSPVEAEEHGF